VRSGAVIAGSASDEAISPSGTRLLRFARNDERGRIARVAAALFLLAATPAARADDFYAGKEITLYIGSTPGGGYDSYARLLARHWGDHIPGHPAILPVNMPGAGSNKLAYYMYAVAPKDGTAAAEIFAGAIMEPVIGDKPVQDDPSKFGYLGSANNEVFLCAVRSDAPIKTFAEAFKIPVRLAASAEGGSSRDFPAMLDNVLGAKFKIAVGYPGSREMMLAVDQGEVGGLCGIGVSSYAEARPDWFPSGKMIPIAQEALKPDPEFSAKHVPMTLDFAKTDEQRQVLSLMYSQGVFGRPFIVPPGVPADRLEILRRAFVETLRDPATIADAKRARLPLDPISGEEVAALVAKVYATPPAIVKRLKEAIATIP
jgi:tripartite-type tricarboxylate transporter receptor subunit TctC